MFKVRTQVVAFALALFVLAAVVVSTTPAWAQANATGTVLGVVTDPSGAVVPGAAVTMTDNATGATRTTTTNDQGRYAFTNSTPGSYNISVTKQGFAAAKIANQVVVIGQQLTANVQLQVGQASQEIVVEGAAAATLQTLNATVGDTLSGSQLTDLPNIGRDVSTLTVLQPGVSPTGSVAGAIYDQNTYQLDGGNNTNDMDGSMNIYTPSYASDPTNNGAVGGAPTGVMPTPVESIEEFKVATNNQTADFNGSSGGQVQLVTKRGTNQWHGSVYEFYFGTWGGANTWDNNNNTPITRLKPQHRNRFGAAGGGPILPKMFGGKTYLFANYEGSRFPSGTNFTHAVPTDFMRAGVIFPKGEDMTQCGADGGVPVTLAENGATGCGINLNPAAVTVRGIRFPSTGTRYDPRGLGISPVMTALWGSLPLANVPKGGDQLNTENWTGGLALPQKDNFGVVRLDHDFGDKWHFMSSYRYYHLIRTSSSQVDFGGALKGDTKGQAVALGTRPQVPWYLVGGMTTNISSNVTNDFHASYLRNYWAWATDENLPQTGLVAGIGGAVEPGGESSGALIPYNVNTQSVRTRFWDGQDWMYRDDLNMLKGNHLFQIGGTYEHNWDWHQRNDNGGGVMTGATYRLQGLGTTAMTPFAPAGLPSSKIGNYAGVYSDILGIVAISQDLFVRQGPTLALQPPHSHAFDQSNIDSYNVYFSDTWHMKPTFTLTYGASYLLQLPPVERRGKQVVLVDASGQPISTDTYFKTKQAQALQGNNYNPTLGYSLVANVNGGEKYPYSVYYGGFSPRLSFAWNPRFDGGLSERIFGKDTTVIRGGYSVVYGRINGVDQVLVPLLGIGLLQPVQCVGALKSGGCNGSTSLSPAAAFRLGPTAGGWDGLTAPEATAAPTLPQPFVPGVIQCANGIGPSACPGQTTFNAGAGAASSLDPNFRPSISHQFDLTIQRALGAKATLEIGYIGRIMRHEWNQTNLDAVPYMLTKNGQSFASAYAAVEKQLGCTINAFSCGTTAVASAPNTVTPQPFFEAAMNPAYCSGYTSCTAAVLANEGGNFTTQSVYDLWTDLNNVTKNANTGVSSPGFNFGRSMPSSNGETCFGSTTPCLEPVGQQGTGFFIDDSRGFGNYNGLFFSLKLRDFHGLTSGSTFTYSKTLGTGDQVQATSEYTDMDPFNLNHFYGVQFWDQKYVVNHYMTYNPPWFRNQQGIVGRLLGGWSISPLFTFQSGFPDGVGMSGCQSFGEVNCSNGGTYENAVQVASFGFDGTIHKNVPGDCNTGIACPNANNLNLFANPVAAYKAFRPLILGIDTKNGGAGNLRGLRNWNLDLGVTKDFRIVERVGASLFVTSVNVLNHAQLYDPGMNVLDPSYFGTIANGCGCQANSPRRFEFGLRVHF